jgi:alkylation response protein AidB-like acyl-CoA dehydrogenase
MTAGPADERAAFHRRVEEWFAANAPRKGCPGDFSAVHIVSADSETEYKEAERVALETSRAWQKKLHAAGLAGRSWPSAYGGQDAPAWQDQVIADVQSRYGVSTKFLSIALEMVPPVLMKHGSHDQRLRHIPAVLGADETWCQLLSEPDAGSDLGSAQTLAAPVPGGWAVSGQKVWTSNAGTSDFALLIARTDRAVRGLAGLSCLILDMSQHGVDVRPLRQMSGAYHFNEVFLDDAFVPQESLLGQPGGARSVLRTMLSSERSAIGGGTSARSAGQLIQLAVLLGRQDERCVRQLLTQAYIRERLLDLTLARLASSDEIPGGGSLGKLMYSEHARLSADAGASILGAAITASGTPEARPWLERLLFAPGLRIGGGTDEIQRNALAERGLGLPRG